MVRDYSKSQFGRKLKKYGFRKVEFDLLGGDYYYISGSMTTPTSHVSTRREKLAYLIKADRKWRERREKMKQVPAV